MKYPPHTFTMYTGIHHHGNTSPSSPKAQWSHPQNRKTTVLGHFSVRHPPFSTQKDANCFNFPHLPNHTQIARHSISYSTQRIALSFETIRPLVFTLPTGSLGGALHEDTCRAPGVTHTLSQPFYPSGPLPCTHNRAHLDHCCRAAEKLAKS